MLENKEKNWRGNKGRHLGVMMGDQRRHQNRLPAVGKRKIAVQQILPILTYSCELYPEPSEQQHRLAAELQRWVVGAMEVEELTGIADLWRLMQNKRIR